MFFFFNDTATTEIYTLSLHDALPISNANEPARPNGIYVPRFRNTPSSKRHSRFIRGYGYRSEEHTSELQSQSNLVCRLLLEKKKQVYRDYYITTNERHSCVV